VEEDIIHAGRGLGLTHTEPHFTEGLYLSAGLSCSRREREGGMGERERGRFRLWQ